MKNKDLKKGRESIIGKIIYGFLLFMPLIAIFSTILISTFNKNSTTTTTEAYEINNVNTIDYETIYYIDSSYYTSNPNTTNSQITLNLIVDKIYYQSFNNDLTNLNRIYLNSNDNNLYLYNGSSVITQVNPNMNLKFSFHIQNYAPYNTTTENYLITLLKTRTENTYSAQNIFYDSVDKVEQSELFNWAQNSLIYTGIADTCTQLSITNTFIPLLLAYWLIISVIYILYDIILMILIILHNKVHQIQDSI